MNGGTIVDLFCGCGGFSLGAEQAGFRSLTAVDVDPVLQSGYRRNFPTSRTVQASVADLDSGAWRHFIGSQRPDGVIGGPPCQGFSWIGKRRSDDERNSLVAEFFRHVALLRPRFFVMENVTGLLHHDRIGILQEGLLQLPSQYRVLEPVIVNAADFGAATSRSRVVVVGYDPDEMEQVTEADLVLRPLAVRVTVRDAISDLPSPVAESADKTDFGWASYPTSPPQAVSPYAAGLRAPPPAGLASEEARRRMADGEVSGMTSTRHSAEIERRYAAVRAGQSDPKTKSYKLDWDGQCPTLRAGTGPDKGAFQAVRPLHPRLGRVITVREAARLQGFPDWFTFHPTKWHSFRMIGNSVSPFVSAGLLGSIARRMNLRLAA